MTFDDVSRTVATVSALRTFLARLPHVPTPLERRRLHRCAEVAAAPTTVTATDAAAVIAGWRAWWRDGRISDIERMAAALPREFVEGERELASLALAAAQRLHPAH